MNDSARDIIEQLHTLPHSERMPALFIGHGNPMNAINDSAYAKVWREVGAALPTPRAIACMSAHWLTDGTYASTMEIPSLIYDFYGFPEELYRVSYPVKGDTGVVGELTGLASSILPDPSRGLDHGVWTVLMHLMPAPHNIPVMALSIDFGHSAETQFSLMERLRPLRDKGVLFVGSGNIVHNLMMMREDEPFDWAIEFDALSRELIARKDSGALLTPEKLGATAELAVPTDDHYRPMLNTLALVHPHETIHFFNESIDLGSVSMRSFIAL